MSKELKMEVFASKEPVKSVRLHEIGRAHV